MVCTRHRRHVTTSPRLAVCLLEDRTRLQRFLPQQRPENPPDPRSRGPRHPGGCQAGPRARGWSRGSPSSDKPLRVLKPCSWRNSAPYHALTHSFLGALSYAAPTRSPWVTPLAHLPRSCYKRGLQPSQVRL